MELGVGVRVLLGDLDENDGTDWGGEMADIFGAVEGGYHRVKREVVKCVSFQDCGIPIL